MFDRQNELSRKILRCDDQMACKSNVKMITKIKCVNTSCIPKPMCLDAKGIDKYQLGKGLSYRMHEW